MTCAGVGPTGVGSGLGGSTLGLIAVGGNGSDGNLTLLGIAFCGRGCWAAWTVDTAGGAAGEATVVIGVEAGTGFEPAPPLTVIGVVTPGAEGNF